MANLPLVNTALLPLDQVRYELTHTNRLYSQNSPDADASHIHGCYEVYVNVTGDVAFLVNNTVYAIESGDLVITKPGDVHLCIYRQTCMHDHYCLWLDAPADSPLVAFAEKPGRYRLPREERKSMLVLLHRLTEEAQEPFARTLDLLRLIELFGSSKNEEVSAEPPIPEEMQRILDYMNLHYRELRVKDLHQAFFISPATLNRWFRKYLHLSAREFLEAKKLSYAKQLLSEGVGVTETSMRAGFSDCSHFIAVFKKKFGRTPYVYRRMMDS